MDLERKLELMERYDFSGFVNKVKGIQSGLALMSRSSKTESERKAYAEGILEIYKFLENCYARIDFDEIKWEMEEDDRYDFHTLFEVRELLPQFREAIEKYISFA
jgi:hypothetical protein